MKSNFKNKIFIHIPKCGGLSIIQNTECLRIANNHATIKQVVEKYGEDFVKEKGLVTVVRNPYERLVSMFYYYKKVSPVGIKEEKFHDWLENGMQINEKQHWVARHWDLYYWFDYPIHMTVYKLEDIGEHFPLVNCSEHFDYRSYFPQKTKEIVDPFIKDSLFGFKYRF